MKKKGGIVRWLNLQAISVHKQSRRLYSFSELVLASPYVFFFPETLAYVCLPVCPFSFPDRELDQQAGLAWWAWIQHLSRWRMQPRFNEVSASWPWKRVSTCLVASSEQYFLKKINSKVWNWSWYSEVRITIMSLRTWPRTHQSNGRCTTFADDSSLLGKSLWVVSFCCF